MYNAVVGTCAQQGAAAGGGGVASVSVATSATGNYDNAVEVIFVNTSAVVAGQNPQNSTNFSGGILGGAQSTFGTATSPTRTTQTITASAADYLSSWSANGTGNGTVKIGGYIRSNNFTSANKTKWLVATGTILSQSFSTGVSVSALSAPANRDGIRDNTFGSSTFGIYNQMGHGAGSSVLFGIRIVHAGGRGATTLPQAGDSFTFRLSAEDDDGSTTYTAIHDVTITWA
jgi:hypothetical protein